MEDSAASNARRIWIPLRIFNDCPRCSAPAVTRKRTSKGFCTGTSSASCARRGRGRVCNDRSAAECGRPGPATCEVQWVLEVYDGNRHLGIAAPEDGRTATSSALEQRERPTFLESTAA